MPIVLKRFQREVGDGILAHFANLRAQYAAAVHPDYGRVFIAGHRRNETEFLLLRKGEHALEGDGAFAPERLRWT